ncbi:uncharacterized protein M8220_012692 isoform 3-T3 [Acridotheres tristis]
MAEKQIPQPRGPGRPQGRMFPPRGPRRGHPRQPGPWWDGPCPPAGPEDTWAEPPWAEPPWADPPWGEPPWAEPPWAEPPWHEQPWDEQPWDEQPWNEPPPRHQRRRRRSRQPQPRPFPGPGDIPWKEEEEGNWAPHDCPPQPPWDDREFQGAEDGFGDGWHSGTSRTPNPLPPPPSGASPWPGRSCSPRSLPSPLLPSQVLQRARTSRRMCQWGVGVSWSPPVRLGALWRAQLPILVLWSRWLSWEPGRPLWAARSRIPVLWEQIRPLWRRPPGVLRSRSTLSAPVTFAQAEPCSPAVPKAGSGHGSHPQSPAAPPDPAKRELLESSSSGEAGAELSPHSWEQPPRGAGEAEAEAAQDGSLRSPENPQVAPGCAAEPKAQPSQASPGACRDPETSQHPPSSGETNPAVSGQHQRCSMLPSPFPAGIDFRSAAVLAKKAEIELSYQQFSLTIAVVATMLLQKEPSMEAALGVALRANLRQCRIHHLQQLEDFIDTIDSL